MQGFENANGFQKAKMVSRILTLIPWSRSPDYLSLPKRTVQTVLKKRRSKKVPEGLLEREKELSYGLCGDSLIIYGEVDRFGDPVELSGPNLIKYQRILMNSRTIKRISVDIDWKDLPLPNKLLHSFQARHNLQSLKLFLTVEQFGLFSKILNRAFHLRELSVTLHSDQVDESFGPQEAEYTILKFCEGLKNQKSLRRLRIDLKSNEFFHTGEVANILFGHLGDLNLSHADIFSYVPKTECFDAEKCGRFLATFEFLALESDDFENVTTSLQKNLFLLADELENLEVLAANFEAILVRCSSLKCLEISSLAILGIIPASLGLAKNLHTLKLSQWRLSEWGTTQQRIELPQKLAQLFSDCSQLKNFKVYTDELGDLITIQRAFERSSSLQSYSLHLHESTNSSSFEQLCEQISQIKTIEKLSLTFPALGNMLAKKVFEQFPKVKQLEFRVNERDQSVPFPIESLAALHSVENLSIGCRGYNRNDLMERLPKLSPCLKNLQIYDWNMEITLKDYKKKFALS